MAKNELLSALSSLPNIASNYFENIPEESLDVRRLPTAWTIREHLYHIAGIQAMLLARLDLMYREPQPVIVPYFPDKETEKLSQWTSASEALARYRELRAAQLAVFEKSTDEVFSRPARHAEYQDYSMGVLLHHMVFHEYWHLYRIEELWLTKDEYLTELL